jgi:hypothetical protein
MGIRACHTHFAVNVVFMWCQVLPTRSQTSRRRGTANRAQLSSAQLGAHRTRESPIASLVNRL